jgi:hypothetical protein
VDLFFVLRNNARGEEEEEGRKEGREAKDGKSNVSNGTREREKQGGW